MNLLELATQYPHAFQDLPEPYQNDDCLFFWEDGGTLYATPSPDQTSVLGSWQARYDDVGCQWTYIVPKEKTS